MKTKTFKKYEHICKANDFLNIYKRGIRLYSDNFIILISDNYKNYRRLGLSIGKHIGNAVKRNRIKRLVREFFRLNKDIFPPLSDIIVKIRIDISSNSFKKIGLEFEKLLLKIQK